MSQRRSSNDNRYMTRSQKAHFIEPNYVTESKAKGKMTEAPTDDKKLPKMASRKRKLDESTSIQPSALSVKRPEKPSAPSKPSPPKKPRGTMVAARHGAYGKADSLHQVSPPRKKQKKKTDLSSETDNEEKRLRVFRKKAPLSYLEKLERATSQRMFVIDRSRGGTDDVPEETIDMAGTTGNIYSITISQVPKCTCPDNQKGNQCKHIVYVGRNQIFCTAAVADCVSAGPSQCPQSSRASSIPARLPLIRKPTERTQPLPMH